MDDSRTTAAPKTLKILMTADCVGGVWRYSVDLARGLVEHGAEVLLATLGPRPSREQRDELLEVAGITLVESDFALEWMPNPWRDIDASGKWLLDLQSEFHPGLVHLNGYAHASMAWQSPVIVVAHSCVYSWWRAVHGCAPGPEWSEYKRRVTAGLAQSDVVVAPSAYMARAVETEYNVPAEKIRVIHNFSRAPEWAGVTRQPFFLAAGRMWDAAKNLALLDTIAPKLKWEIRVAGSDRGAPMPHAELLSEMTRCRAFLHPALYEPFGLSVLEAARAGCCLVLSDIPSLNELWQGSALFIDPRDPEEWIFELNRLCDHPERLDELGTRAFQHARNYSTPASIGSYWRLYSSLLNAKKGDSKEVAA